MNTFCEIKVADCFFFFLFSVVTGPERLLSLELSDTSVYKPQIVLIDPRGVSSGVAAAVSERGAVGHWRLVPGVRAPPTRWATWVSFPSILRGTWPNLHQIRP